MAAGITRRKKGAIPLTAPGVDLSKHFVRDRAKFRIPIEQALYHIVVESLSAISL
jgi:hypothetical protein